MKNAALVTIFASLLTACAGSSTQAPPSESTSSGSSVTDNSKDYSKVICSDLQECNDACDMIHPYLEESDIRNALCKLPFDSSDMCDSIVDFSKSDSDSNTLCKSLHVTEVIQLASIGQKTCATDTTGCSNACDSAFQAQDDQAIERAASVAGLLESGATLKALYRNHLVMEQHAACLNASAYFVVHTL